MHGEMTLNLAFLLACARRFFLNIDFSCFMFIQLYHFFRSQACDSSPCLNGGTCFEDESGKEYMCKCSSGWKGDNCEKNMTGSH